MPCRGRLPRCGPRYSWRRPERRSRACSRRSRRRQRTEMRARAKSWRVSIAGEKLRAHGIQRMSAGEQALNGAGIFFRATDRPVRDQGVAHIWSTSPPRSVTMRASRPTKIRGLDRVGTALTMAPAAENSIRASPGCWRRPPDIQRHGRADRGADFPTSPQDQPEPINRPSRNQDCVRTVPNQLEWARMITSGPSSAAC